MKPRRTLRLGTRGSDLAMWQAKRIAGLISDRLDVECTIEVIKTRGDRIQDVRGLMLNPDLLGCTLLIHDDQGRFIGRGKASSNRIRNMLPRHWFA